jgi:hypothetical protein
VPIFKGTLLGLWLVGFATLARFYFDIVRPLPAGTSSYAVSVSMIWHLTIRSVAWWVGVAVCFAIGVGLTRVWKGPRAFWIALGVTGLIPAGFWVLIGVLYYLARTMS